MVYWWKWDKEFLRRPKCAAARQCGGNVKKSSRGAKRYEGRIIEDVQDEKEAE